MLPEVLLPRRPETERHELALVGRRVLDDAHVRDPLRREARRDDLERRLVRRGEHDGVRPGVGGPGLPCGVHDLRGEEPYREIPSDDHVVGDGVRAGSVGLGSERYVSRFSVGTRTAWT